MKKFIVFLLTSLILSGCVPAYTEEPFFDPTVDAGVMEWEAEQQARDWAIEEENRKADEWSDYKLEKIKTTEAKIDALSREADVIEEGCPQGCTFHLDGCDIKGNISFTSNEKIYHVPGGEFYNDTKIDPDYGERWFCSEEEAKANGWRRSYK